MLEHPEASKAFATFDLPRPIRGAGWQRVPGEIGWWVCCVEQGHYGHAARKATWLFYVGRDPAPLIWGPSSGVRLDEGFHSKAERDAARAAGRKPIKRLSKRENVATPIAFRDALISLAVNA